MNTQPITTLGSLREVRERLLRFSFDFVVRRTEIARERLSALESGAAHLTVSEADVLSRLYGIDDDALAEAPIEVPRNTVPGTLGCIDEFLDIGDSTRADVVRVALAARDVVRLRGLLELPPPQVPQFHPTHSDVPFETGRDAANRVRQDLGPFGGPIVSMRDWVREHLPGVAVLYASLGDYGPAGLTFAGDMFGPAIVLNLDGKNTNPSVRRFSLAHEVYHLLVDWERTEPLAVLSGYLDESQLAREQRANSFAIRFLCPERELLAIKGSPERVAEQIMLSMGLHYQATRLYMRNERKEQMPAIPPTAITGAEANWERSELPDGIDGFPITRVPTERRTIVARLAAQAYSEHRIRRDRFADFLGVTPAEKVERVLDFFGLDVPSLDA